MNITYDRMNFDDTVCCDPSDLRLKIIDFSTEINQKVREANQRLRQIKNNLRLVPLSGYTDYRRNLITLKEMETKGLLEPNVSMERTSQLKQLLISHMRHMTCLNHQRNVLSFYLTHVKKFCDELCLSNDREQSQHLMTTQLEELISVCHLLPPVTEIVPGDQENVTQYENLASILRCCHEVSLSNSRVVVQLLLLILKMHLADANDTRFIKHQSFGTSFVQFVLHHVEKENFDLEHHLFLYPNTLKEFRSLFSIVDATALGEEQIVVPLLSYGLPISLSQSDELSEHSLLFRSEVLTPEQILVLEIMKKVEQQIMGSVEHETPWQGQKNCFQLAVQKHPELAICKTHLQMTINEENKRLLQQSSHEGNEFRKLKRLVKMYEKHFCCRHERKLPQSGIKHMSRMQYGLGETNKSDIFIMF